MESASPPRKARPRRSAAPFEAVQPASEVDEGHAGGDDDENAGATCAAGKGDDDKEPSRYEAERDA